MQGQSELHKNVRNYGPIIILSCLILLLLFLVPAHARTTQVSKGELASSTIQEIIQEVLPTEGFQTKLVLGNVVPTMVQAGIIDMTKVVAHYQGKGGIPAEKYAVLTQTSNIPLVVNKDNTLWLINILWPIGLSNYMRINEHSPIAGEKLSHYASTVGWTLGKIQYGSFYFNTFPLISLTTAQEQHIKEIAKVTFRPCCDNSSFFQDCNHGSAALGIIELGVKQGLSDNEIYKTILDFNSFWFQQEYLETALYFKLVKHMDWKDVDPKLILSKDYSSLSGWNKNVHTAMSKFPGLVPNVPSGSTCGA